MGEQFTQLDCRSLVGGVAYLIRTAFEIESCKNVPHMQTFGALYFFGRYDVRRTDISPKLL